MNNPTDAEIGQTVYLKPGNKTAPRECYLGLPGELVSVDEWPFVHVAVNIHPGGGADTLRLHRLNVVLHPPGFTLKKEGDGQNNSEPEVKVKPAFRPHKPLSDGDWEEPMLF